MKHYLKSYLEALCIEHGGKLTPDIVLASAISEESPIHHCFEWEESNAAAQYRLLQAADLIRKVKVKVRVGESDIRSVRAYVNIANPADDKLNLSLSQWRRRIYVPVTDALRKVSTRDQVISALYREVIEWQRRAEAYEVFAEACKAVKKIRRSSR